MKRVLLFARDPGGANTIIPLVGPLRDKRYDVRLFGKDTALRKYADASLDGADIMGTIAAVTPESIINFLRTTAPDIVVTGTSGDDHTEKYLWHAATKLGIPSLAILDQWVNYGIRFSDYGLSEIAGYSMDRRHPCLPSRIVTMDAYAKAEMIAEGLPEERIVVCGQPYFETMANYRQDSSATADFCRRNGINPDDFVIVFASEPMTLAYEGRATDYWGYDEHSILNSLTQALGAISRQVPQRLVLVVRPHPKEDTHGLTNCVASSGDIAWTMDRETSPWTLMDRADLVCGMSSMFLIESVIMGRPTLSIQVGLKQNNPFILDRQGVLKSILAEDELYSRLRSIIIDGDRIPAYFDIIPNPVERIVAEMENLLCQNWQ